MSPKSVSNIQYEISASRTRIAEGFSLQAVQAVHATYTTLLEYLTDDAIA